jgi:carbon storage regulator
MYIHLGNGQELNPVLWTAWRAISENISFEIARTIRGDATKLNERESRRISIMLVLSRRERERLKVGESIVVTVIHVSGDRVRLGIDAPSDILVLREELDRSASAGVTDFSRA